MELFKTVDNDECLRIESAEGAAITIRKDRFDGHILSIVVPEDERGGGSGRKLLLAAEKELLDCFIEHMDADFQDMIPGLASFFAEAGFAAGKDTAIVSVPMEKLLHSEAVKKVVFSGTSRSGFVSLSSLPFEKWDELIDVLKHYHVCITNNDMTRLNQELSGVAYDEDKHPQAVIFCSDNGRDLHVDFLLGVGKNAQVHIASALKGLLSGLIEGDALSSYDNLTAIASNKNVTALIERALANGEKPEEVGHILYMRRKLRESDEKIRINDSPEEDSAEQWRREIRKYPLQPNASYKLPFSRMSDKTPKKEATKEVAKEQHESQREADGPLKIYFYKENEERVGLVCADTFRITEDNLARFSEYLPADVARDIIRPFYRGLVVQKDTDTEPQAIMAWQYEKMEQFDATEAKIIFFHANSKDDGRTILSEYKHEIEAEKTAKSYFWMPTLTEEEQGLFSDAGFSLEQRESVDLVLTKEDFDNVSLFRNKNTRFVRCLREVPQKAYKRSVARASFLERDGMIEDLTYLSRTWFDQDISCCMVMDEKVTGMILAHGLDGGIYFIDLILPMGSDPAIETLYMIRFFLNNLLEKKGDDFRVLLRLDNEGNIQLAKLFFSEKRRGRMTFGERKEGK